MFSHVTSDQVGKLEELASTLSRAKKAIVITGAGISTSCGIPDFRSKEGLYSLMSTAHSQKTQGQTTKIKGADLFNVNLFRDADQTATFYQFIAALRAKTRAVTRTSITHKLIRKLRDDGRLVRCYTQNIDGFESREGLCNNMSRGAGNRKRSEKKAQSLPRSSITTAPGGEHDGGCEAVPLHGELSSLRCTICSHQKDWTEEEQDHFRQGTAPECPECATQNEIRRCIGKRSTRVGCLRPNIVLYGEEHPSTDTISAIRQSDLSCKPDLLLVMGTSLKVDGLKMLVREMAQAVHERKEGRVIFINLTAPAASTWGETFDAWVDMDCDSWVRRMKSLRPEIWQTQTRLSTRPAPQRRSTEKMSSTKNSSQATSSVRVVIPHVPADRTDIQQKSRKRGPEEAGLEEVHCIAKRKRIDPVIPAGNRTTGETEGRVEGLPVEDTIILRPKKFGTLGDTHGPRTAARRRVSDNRLRAGKRLVSDCHTATVQPEFLALESDPVTDARMQVPIEIHIDDTDRNPVIDKEDTHSHGQAPDNKNSTNSSHARSECFETSRKASILRPSQSRVSKPTRHTPVKSRSVLAGSLDGAFGVSRLLTANGSGVGMGKHLEKENMRRPVRRISSRSAM